MKKSSDELARDAAIAIEALVRATDEPASARAQMLATHIDKVDLEELEAWLEELKWNGE